MVLSVFEKESWFATYFQKVVFLVWLPVLGCDFGSTLCVHAFCLSGVVCLVCLVLVPGLATWRAKRVSLPRSARCVAPWHAPINVRNGQDRYLGKYLDQISIEEKREVTRAIGYIFLLGSEVNCCVKIYCYVHRRLIKRRGPKHLHARDITRSRMF
jgi:hypothetical protein